MALTDIRRSVLYDVGVQERLEQLICEYGLDKVVLNPGDIVVDVGANIGEITRSLELSERQTYVAIDPDPRVWTAIHLNVPSAVVVRAAASNGEGRLALTLKTHTPDSGFHSSSLSSERMLVPIFRIDILLERLPLLEKPIGLLK